MESSKYSGVRSCSDHVHMLLDILPKKSISSFIGFLKEKIILIIYEK